MKKVFENWYKVAALLCLAFVALTFSPSPAHAATYAGKVDSVPVWYLQHKATGENLYTTDTNEVKVLSAKNWKNLGIAFYAPTTGTPVYRMNYRNGVDHHYVTQDSEVRDLLTRGTWALDRGRVMWYSGGDIRTTRLYSPTRAAQYKKGKTISGFHMFTTNGMTSSLRAAGWQADAVKMYAFSVQKPVVSACSNCGGSGHITVTDKPAWEEQVYDHRIYIITKCPIEEYVGMTFDSSEEFAEWTNAMAQTDRDTLLRTGSTSQKIYTTVYHDAETHLEDCPRCQGTGAVTITN